MEKFEKMKKQKGISMVSLVITIIVILILSAIVFTTSLKTIGEADYSKYVSNVSDVSSAFYEASTAVNGNKTTENQTKNIEQVYNYVAKNGIEEKDFLPRSEVPTYTIIKDEAQIGISLPKIIVESGTGKRVPLKYATTKNGQIFTWPPFDYDGKFYITDFDMVEHKMQTEITVGNEKFTIEIDSTYGTLLDAPSTPNEDEEPGENIPEEHDFSSKTQTTDYLCSEATCASPAVYYFKCTKCDAKGTETYTVGNALGHILGEYKTVKEANCTEKGIKQSICERCGTSSNMEIPIDSNNHKEDTNPQISTATCTTNGTKVYKCEFCKIDLRTESIPALEHSFGNWVTTTLSTCKDKGIQTSQCIRCTETKTQEIPIDESSHRESTEPETTTPAKCTEVGTLTYKCSVCGKAMRTEEIPALGHSYGEFEITKEATCSETGIQTKTCTICNDTVTETIPKNTSNHVEIQPVEATKEATCTETGTVPYKCTKCGATIRTETIDALGHIDSDNNNICDRCGLILLVVDGLGEVEVSDPDIELDYDPSTGELGGFVPPEENETEIPEEIPEEKFPEIIEFNFGKFELETNYAPETYETVEYENTYTRTKYPVTYQNYIWSGWTITKDDNGNVIKTESREAALSGINEQYSTYIVYDFETDKVLEVNGVKGDSIELWTIYENKNDNLENAVYLAAYLNKLDGKTSRHIAKWNGTQYVAYNADEDIVAVDTFIETYTVAETKQVKITETLSINQYVYMPIATLRAEAGMTWEEWLKSSYNTTGESEVIIKTADYDVVTYSDTIIEGESYGFFKYELEGTWYLNDELNWFDNTYNFEYKVPGYTAETVFIGFNGSPLALSSGGSTLKQTFITSDGVKYYWPSSLGEQVRNWEVYSTIEEVTDANGSSTAGKDLCKWFYANATKIESSDETTESEGKYYVGVTSTTAGDYTGATATYTSMNDLPTASDGDVYVYGNYEYRYNYFYTGTAWSYSSSVNGWGVRCINNVEAPGEILKNINSEPITVVNNTFKNCTELVSGPEIPSTVIAMVRTFEDCTKLKDAFAIPPNVTSMLYTFAGCSSLVSAPVISSKVNTFAYTFKDCTSLTGNIEINSNPTAWTQCLYNTNITSITGSTTMAEKLMLTKTSTETNPS